MNKQETKNAIEVMQAFLDGKAIESKKFHTQDWHVIEEPMWCFDKQNYRVAVKMIDFQRILNDIHLYVGKTVVMIGRSYNIVGRVDVGGLKIDGVLLSEPDGRLTVHYDMQTIVEEPK